LINCPIANSRHQIDYDYQRRIAGGGVKAFIEKFQKNNCLENRNRGLRGKALKK